MRISKELDYAIQLVDALTKLKDDELLSLKKFSKESSISFLFLQRIARSLKKVNLIDSVRGVHGGYFLNKKKVSLKEVVDALEGREYKIMKCLADKKSCKKSSVCPARKLFKKVDKKMNECLSDIYIGE